MKNLGRYSEDLSIPRKKDVEEKYTMPTGGIPKSDLSSSVQSSLDKAETALQTAPVTSVNGKTGAVTLGKSDVGLGNVDNVRQYSAQNPPPYPVTSVNEKTGAVVLSATDVSAIPSTLTGTAGQVLTKTADGQEWKDAADVPQPSTTTPLAPTEAGAVGTSTVYARGDHVHPKQTVTKSDVGLGNVDNVSINTRMNRTTNVNAADSNYTTYMARGEALFSSETTPTVNGCIAWQYE